MTEQSASYGEELTDTDVTLGKCWAALRNDQVVGIISMRVPKDVAFDVYRQKATECLELLGQVKSGELVERKGERYFVQRLNHANRSKKPRQAKEYRLYQPRNG